MNINIKRITIPQHLLLFAGVVSCVLGYASPWWLLVPYLGWFFVGFLGFNIFYHRYIAHSAFKTIRIIEVVGVYLGLLSGRGSPLFMANVHTPLHHAYSDTEKDPHTPLKGFWHAYILWQNKPITFQRSQIRRIYSDDIFKFFSVHYFKIFWISALLLALIDWRLMVFGLMGGGVLQGHFEAIIQTFAHMPGYGTQDCDTGDNSRNLRGLYNLVTLGSGLHNNHHSRAGSYTYKVKPNDFDVATHIIEWLAIPGTLRTR